MCVRFSNQMDPLASAVAMAAANPGVNVSAMNSQYPAGLSGLGGPPGSPAKNFSQLGQSLGPVAQAQNASYNSMQALTSQLQGNYETAFVFWLFNVASRKVLISSLSRCCEYLA